jgi:small redox-active disulfide protein 2
MSQQSDRKEKKMEIKVLGPGCPKCKQTEQNVKDAVTETGIDATVEKVTDVMEIAGYGVFGTPSVVIDGEVKSVGKIPTKEDVKAWFRK